MALECIVGFHPMWSNSQQHRKEQTGKQCLDSSSVAGSKQVVLWKLIDAVYTDCEKDGPFYVGQIKKMNLREFNNAPQVT